MPHSVPLPLLWTFLLWYKYSKPLFRNCGNNHHIPIALVEDQMSNVITNAKEQDVLVLSRTRERAKGAECRLCLQVSQDQFPTPNGPHAHRDQSLREE